MNIWTGLVIALCLGIVQFTVMGMRDALRTELRARWAKEKGKQK